MGKQNQQRRAAKKRRQRESAGRRAWSDGRHRHVPPSGGVGEPALEDLVWAAAGWLHAAPATAEMALDELTARGRAAIDVASHLLQSAVGELGDRGWSPEDLRHVLARRLSAAHAAVARGEWIAGPAANGHGTTVRDGLRRLVETLDLVRRLPEVPQAGPPDAAAPGLEGLDARVLAKVRALLNKAESTDFPEEAEALTSKAQELISRHAIDSVLLRHGQDQGQPTSRRVYLDDPYVDAKALLLERVARANRCSAVYTPACGWSTVFGFDADLDAMELLTASLLAQAAHVLARHGSRVDGAGRSRTKSFRRAFWLGFADRIGRRLSEANEEQVTAAGQTDGRLLPVLAARDERVQAAQAAAYPNLSARSSGVSNMAGWVAGTAAAESANLSVGAGMLNRQT